MIALTPASIAKRYGVGRDKVFSWIRAGELQALNVATRLGGRPRYIITPERLAAFEAKRAVMPRPATARRRRRADSGVIQFF